MSQQLTITRKVCPSSLFEGLDLEHLLATITIKDAREKWRECGGPGSPSSWILTDPTHSPKGAKSTNPEYILYLAPVREAGTSVDMCPRATHGPNGCASSCLYTAGRGKFASIRAGRVARTRFMVTYPAHFLVMVAGNLKAIAKRSRNAGTSPWVRLNGTSDVPWERSQAGRQLIRYGQSLGIGFGDYTKFPAAERDREPYPSYMLARSAWPTQKSAEEVIELWRSGESVSVVVDDIELLIALGTLGIVSADKSDEWLRLPEPTIGVLSPKGDLRSGEPGKAFYRAVDLARALGNASSNLQERTQ